MDEPNNHDILNICGELLDAAGSAPRFNRFLANFCAMIDAPVMTLSVASKPPTDPTSAAVDLAFSFDFGAPPEAYLSYPPFVLNDPVSSHNYGEGRPYDWPSWMPDNKRSRLEAGEFVLWSELVPQTEIHELDVYKGHYSLYDFEYGMDASCVLDTGHLCALAAARTSAQEPFSERERDIADVCRPLVFRAAESHIRIHQLKLEAALARHALDSFGFGLAFLAGDGRVVFSNKAFDRFIADGEAMALTRGRVRCRDDDTQTRLLSELDTALERAAAGEHDHGQPLRIPKRDGTMPLTALISTINPLVQDPFYDRHLRPYALFVVTDPDSALALAPPKLMALFDITQAEARVLALLVAGLTLEELTARLGVADSTIRTHIKRLLAKLGVRRQSELVRLVLKSPVAALSESLVANEASCEQTLYEVIREGE